MTQLVTVSQLWMSYTMDKAIKIAKEQQVSVPRNINIIWIFRAQWPTLLTALASIAAQLLATLRLTLTTA